MALNDRPWLFLDIQTTGMRPPQAQILEIAWRLIIQNENPVDQSYLVQMPEGREIPKRVQEITGLSQKDLATAQSEAEVFSQLNLMLAKQPRVIIHYAPFEKPFLKDLFERFARSSEFSSEILCTHQLTQLLFPALPSRNLRATAGFFGPPVLGPNRAAVFVEATEQIWRGLSPELEARGLTEWKTLTEFVNTTKKSKTTRYDYRLDKLKRLALPDEPGVYRMLAKNGEILYVGKATSLKSRVNSYFRGKKGRDSRKLEMLAQVWDLRVTPTRSPLEAALLETDEIKKHDPPYNVALKAGRRQLVFYSREFLVSSPEQTAECPLGPFRQMNWIEPLRLLAASLAQGKFEQIFFDPLEEHLMRDGFDLFCAQIGLDPSQLVRPRSLLAVGLNLYRHFREPEAIAESEDSEMEEDRDEDLELTPEDLAGKFERLLRRAGAQHWRARELTRLLNARITYELPESAAELIFVGGQLTDSKAKGSDFARRALPWQGLDLATFDRMSVLYSELQKYSHQIFY